MGMVLYWLWEAMLISYFSLANMILEFNNLEELLLKSKSKVNYNKFRLSSIAIVILDLICLVTCLLHVICFLQLVLPKGYIAEDFFRYSNDPTIQKVWKKRVKPYMDDKDYPTVSFKVIYTQHTSILG